jgi:hypothetical protein
MGQKLLFQTSPWNQSLLKVKQINLEHDLPSQRYQLTAKSEHNCRNGIIREEGCLNTRLTVNEAKMQDNC